MEIKKLYEASKDRYGKVCRREEALLRELETLQIEKEHHGKLMDLYSSMEYDSIEEERNVTNRIFTIGKKQAQTNDQPKRGIQDRIFKAVKELGSATMEEIKALYSDEEGEKRIQDAIYNLKRKGRLIKEGKTYKIAS